MNKISVAGSNLQEIKRRLFPSDAGREDTIYDFYWKGNVSCKEVALNSSAVAIVSQKGLNPINYLTSDTQFPVVLIFYLNLFSRLVTYSKNIFGSLLMCAFIISIVMYYIFNYIRNLYLIIENDVYTKFLLLFENFLLFVLSFWKLI